MTEAEIQEKVIAIVAEQMGVDKAEIKRETSFTNDLNADSLDIVELVMEFEDQFGTSIPDDQGDKIQTVGSAIDTHLLGDDGDDLFLNLCFCHGLAPI